MEWTGPGIILGTRRHGESSVIVELFSPDHGRHMGLVRGGRGKRMRGVLQSGNRVTVTWRARLEEHLGQYSLEADRLDAASFMADPLRLAALNTLCDLVRLLPERDPHPVIYERYARLLDGILDGGYDGGYWVNEFIRWELLLLQDLGFGLDLTSCAATDSTENLIYVSPKSGRAVSAAAGEPYKAKLLPLPQFLVDEDRTNPSWRDYNAGFALTKYFYARHIFESR
ncbi:MAG: DNA repair protein RecO, partial [Fimbriimonadaceae bacterium]|nr:DNA repair protein RecO [Alphaproteobacteria bacterium]